MARKIHSRLKIEGALTALTPLHVGGYGDSPDTDLPLARNGEDKWYVPGTSLAGVLRDWCVKSFSVEAERIWGPKTEKGKPEEGYASFILIEDAVVDLPAGAAIEIRDGVGIDRAWGVAAEGIKYDRAVLPRGSTLNLKMTVDLIADKADQSKAVIGHLLDALAKGEIQLGAARTRGLGRIEFKLDREKSIYQALSTRTGILQALKGGGEKIEPEKWKWAIEPDERPRLDIAIKWCPRSALMVKAGYDGIGVDMLPLVSAKDDGVSLTLPGSAIKGSLRNHAERIIRTLLEMKKGAPRNAIDRQNFMSQLELPLIDELFGVRGEKEKTHKGLGALSVADCYAVEVMDREAWTKVEQAKANPQESSERWELRQFTDPACKLADASHANQFAVIKQQRFEIKHHVAIDRWTGGAAEGALFSALAPTGTSWEDMSLTLDFKRLPDALPGVMLLLLTLRDLASNRLPLGFATNRGMGEIVIEKINLKGYDLDDDLLKALADVELSGAKMSGLDQGLRGKLKGAWESWIEKNREGKTA